MAEPSVHQVTPRIGLLMAVHNHAGMLEASILSLLSQNYPEFTLTVVDDGSSDDSWTVLTHLQHPRLVVLQQTYTGLIGALNTALQRSKAANFYAIVYPHCTYNAQYISHLMRTLLESPQAGGVYNAMCLKKCHYEPPYQYTDLLSRNLLGYTGIFRFEMLKRIGGKLLEHPLGLWETWRQMGAHKPFVLAPPSLLPLIRVHPPTHPPTSYEKPLRTIPELKTETVPLLKLNILVLGEIDKELTYSLKQNGHQVMFQGSALHAPDLLLLGSPDYLKESHTIAVEFSIPVMWVLNDGDTMGDMLQHQPWWFLVAPVVTRDEHVADILPQLGFQVIRYPGELTSQLAQIPLLLNRFKVTVVIRSYIANPTYLQATLQSLEKMTQPAFWGDMFVLEVERHSRVTEWLKKTGIKTHHPPEPQYFLYLASLLDQTHSSFVLMIDAGVIVAESWFYRVYPGLWHPRVSMASSRLHHSEVGAQHIPFHFRTMPELEHKWNQHCRTIPVSIEQVPRLSDNLLLIKKHVLKYTLRRNPLILPLERGDTFSRLFFTQMNLPLLMCNTTYGVQMF